MSAAEEDTELRDLLIQNLENSGVLGKIKAEMRAAVFLAMEEQERLQNKSPMVNDNLKKCLNSRDGRLVAGLIVDFLQVFNLDFSLSVFQPEINSLSGLDSRDQVCMGLGLSDSDLNKNCPLLIELVKRARHKDHPPGATEGTRRGDVPEGLSQKQIAHAQNKFDCYDKDLAGSVLKEDLKKIFADLFPSLNRNMLESFISDELRAADRSFSKTVDFQFFLTMYRRLFSQCRTVVVQDSGVCSQEGVPVCKEASSPGKGALHTRTSSSSSSGGPRTERPDMELEGEDGEDGPDGGPDDGDSFFDDPLPKPQKTYGCLSLLAADLEAEPVDISSELRKADKTGAQGGPTGSVPVDAGGTGGARRAGGEDGSASRSSHSKKGTSDARETGGRPPGDLSGSLRLDEDVEYDDDFNSHRSDLSRSELSIGEDIEEVSIEGPEHSEKLDETTQDLSVSQISQSDGADYMEEVS